MTAGTPATVDFQGATNVHDATVQDINNTDVNRVSCYIRCHDAGGNTGWHFNKDIVVGKVSGNTSESGTTATFTVLEEKGIDVRIALDVVRAVLAGSCDVVLLFSQDQDFAELADEVRAIARERQRWIRIASAYPVGPGTRNARGVERTDWIPIDRATYEACMETREAR